MLKMGDWLHECATDKSHVDMEQNLKRNISTSSGTHDMIMIPNKVLSKLTHMEAVKDIIYYYL